MWRTLTSLSLLVALCALLPACSMFGGSKRKPKSTARIYEGDSPTVRMTGDAESAGGKLHPYR